ncbi:MAG: hypothetical protein IJN74_07980 [Clostridia bacterium]|nr:hypothetical protein [Clostridia bacterium]
MKSMLYKLAMTPAPSGSEEKICETIISMLPESAKWEKDAHGTLIVHKEGEGDGIVILTAMDTPCLYVTYPEGGFSRFSAVGGAKPSEGMSVVCQGGKKGVIGKDEKGLYIDTGHETLEIGQWAVPTPSLETIGNMCFGASMGRYSAICAVIRALLSDTKKDVWFVFATKSNIRQLSPSFMQKIKANVLISVDVSGANDAPAEKTVFAALGGGTALRVKDAGMISSLPLLEGLEAAPYKTFREVSILRGTGGDVQKAYGGIESVSIGIPTRYLGHANEMVALSDIENTAELLKYYLK